MKDILTFPTLVFILFACAVLVVGGASGLPVIATQTAIPIAFATTSPTPVYGALSVLSVPSGANVLIEGISAGTTPYTIRALPVGSYSLTVRMTGYVDATDTIVIARDQILQKNYTLIPLTTANLAVQKGRLSVESAPAGATVIIDGVNQGITPVSRMELPVGTHNVLLQKAGYLDAADTVTILSDYHVEKSYILVPATVETTPATTAVPTATQTPFLSPGQIQNADLFSEMKFDQHFSVEPFTINVAGRTKQPVITTDSPYLRYQIQDNGTGFASQILIPPNTLIEVDENLFTSRNYIINPQSGYQCSLGGCPVWSETSMFLIATEDHYYNYSHFRWISEEDDVTMLYQVSQYQFPADNEHWQNQYIPGLVCSGPASEFHSDAKGYHYFDINFALVANHKPGDPPCYTGVLYQDNPIGGVGEPLDLIRVPGTLLGLLIKEISIGPVNIGIPAGIVAIQESELTESDLGHPNAGMYIVSTGEFSSVVNSMVEAYLMEMDRTYYVRVVPIRKNGEAGIPSYPVEVLVKRPQVCPPVPPADTVNTITVRPPSVKVASFYLQAFVPNDWVHTDQNGKLVSRAHYLSVTAPPGCDPAVESQKPLMQQDPECMQYFYKTGGGQPNYHFFIDPPEGHWYDTFFEVVKGLFGAFSSVINSVSAAWSDIQAMTVKIVADVIQVISFNSIKCGESDVCKGVLQTGLSVAMTSFGVPPTVPNFAELESMGTEYLAKVAAEEMGVGEVYEALPDDVKNEMIGKANEVGHEMATSLTETTAGVTADAAGSWYIPDPLYYEPHPAFVIVNMYNPNDQPTDPVTLTVKDTQLLYHESEPRYIPALNPGESISIPVILRERFTYVYEPGCTQDSYYTTCGEGGCIPCYWNLWYYKAKEYSETEGADQFYANLYANKQEYNIFLSPTASGEVLSKEGHYTYDDFGNSCQPSYSRTVLEYPPGWVMNRDPFSQDLNSVMWGGYTFTNGNHGLLIGS